MSETIEIRVTTTKAFFGEPLYLGEIIKDLVSQALRLERGSLRVKHSKTDETDAPAINVFVTAVGNSKIGEQLENALSSQFSSGNIHRTMQVSFSFDGELVSEMFTLQDELSVPTRDTLKNAFDNYNEFHSQEDFEGEIRERHKWHMGW